MPVNPDGGGRGGGSFNNSPFLTIQPVSPKSLGNIPVGISTPFSLTFYNSGSSALAVTGFNSTTPQITMLTALPINIPAGGNVTVNFQATPTSPGLDHGETLTFTSNATNSPTTYSINWNAVSVVGGIITTSSQTPGKPLGVLPDTKVNTTSNGGVGVQNTGGVAFQITNIQITSTNPGEFTIPTPPALPFTLNPSGPITTIGILFSPTNIGNETGLLTITTNLASPQNSVAIPLSGLSVLLFPVSILSNATRLILFGFNSGLIKKLLSGVYDDADVDSTLVFNGALWNQPGQEKTLERLEIFYENLGVCTGLIFNLSVLRPSLGADFFDVKSAPISIGTAAADGTERSAFVDLTASGELAFLSITRTKATGPCALTAIVPHFAGRGEKVENE